MEHPPDQPPVPRPRRSIFAIVWAGLLAAVVGGYALVGFMGWDLRNSERDQVPPSARDSAHGYRSFHFWHSGPHGGK